jgi:hypothetical protein
MLNSYATVEIQTGPDRWSSVEDGRTYTPYLHPLFEWAYGKSITTLNGKPCPEVEDILNEVLEKCKKEKDLSRFNHPNWWGNASGFLEYLRYIRNICNKHPYCRFVIR